MFEYIRVFRDAIRPGTEKKIESCRKSNCIQRTILRGPPNPRTQEPHLLLSSEIILCHFFLHFPVCSLVRDFSLYLLYTTGADSVQWTNGTRCSRTMINDRMLFMIAAWRRRESGELLRTDCSRYRKQIHCEQGGTSDRTDAKR